MSVNYTQNGVTYSQSGTSANPQGAAPAGATNVTYNAPAAPPVANPTSTSSPIPTKNIGTTQPIPLPIAPITKNQNSTLASGNASLTGGATGLSLNPDGTLKQDAPQGDSMTNIFKQYTDASATLNSERPSAEATYNSLPEKAALDKAQQDVNTYTGQINAIVSKSQADQLSVTGQGRGIPEAIIGGQQAEISKEAAIQALPLQALLANAQGNLTLAQTHLDTVFKLRMEDAQNQYDYKSKVLDSVYNFATASEQRKIDTQRFNSTQNMSLLTNSINNAQSISSAAMQNNDGKTAAKIAQLTPPDQNSPTFSKDLAAYNKAIGKIQSTAKPDVLKQLQIQATQADLKLKKAEYNASYGAFVNADGTPKTDIKPETIPGFTKLSNGVPVITDTRGVYKTASVGGIPVVKPDDFAKISQTADVQTTLNKAQALYNILNVKNFEGKEFSKDPSGDRATYNALIATLPPDIQKQVPVVGTWTGTYFGGSTSSGNTQFATVRSTLNNNIKSIVPSLSLPKYGQVFSDPASAQTYFNSTGQKSEYANEVQQANELAQRYYNRPANDGEILQVINGQ